MKSLNKIFWLVILLFIRTAPVAYGQSEIPAMEKVSLVTDRTLYIAGEKIEFAATINSRMQTEWSRILYAEMITPDGKREAGLKFPIQNSLAHGCLQIPEDIISGMYYIRAYTKYMRNAGPESYAYVAIKIVNPLKNGVMASHEVNSFSDDFVKGEDEGQEAFSISTDKNEYAPGENVSVTLSLIVPNQYFIAPLSRGRQSKQAEEPGGKPGLTKIAPIQITEGGQNFSVSVVPASSSFVFLRKLMTGDTSGGFRRNLTAGVPALPAVHFYPESRGISITGQLRNGLNGSPVANSRVNLSIIGQGRDFEAVQTDTAGRYYFSLPGYTGHRDIFLCAEKDSLSKPILLVDNDFCPIPVRLPSPEFKLSEAERTAVYNMARNVRIAKYFDPDTIPCSSQYESTTNPFYGKPSDVLVLDQFVQLPTLEEYFNELPSAVRVRKQNGHKYFKVIGERTEMDFFNPLVMVDWVAVNDPEKILAASPSNIARIEVVTVPYVKGNLTYGGIVSILSKKGDFAGIDLPASGIFFNYLFLADTCHCVIPENISPEVPDTRNTLYWNPELEWDANNSASFSFKTPATPGKYNIVLQGIERDGEFYEQITTFIVKEK